MLDENDSEPVSLISEKSKQDDDSKPKKREEGEDESGLVAMSKMSQLMKVPRKRVKFLLRT